MASLHVFLRLFEGISLSAGGPSVDLQLLTFHDAPELTYLLVRQVSFAPHAPSLVLIGDPTPLEKLQKLHRDGPNRLLVQAGKVMEADKSIVEVLTKVTPYKASKSLPIDYFLVIMTRSRTWQVYVHTAAQCRNK